MASEEAKAKSLLRPNGNGNGHAPNPDPTSLTTQQLIRGTDGIRELVFREILALEKSLSTRMDASDKATELLHKDVTRFPTDLDKGIAHLKELHVEKFVGVQKQFEERDVRVTQSATAATTAVNAALQAAKEAVGEQNKSFTLSIDKSEAAIAKRIDALTQTYQTEIRAMGGTINDLKDRLNRNEGSGVGRTAEIVDRRADMNDQRSNSSMTLTVVSIVIAAAGLIGGVIIAVLKHQ